MSIEATAVIDEPHAAKRMFRMLMADKFALCAAIFLIVIVVMAIIGPSWLGDLATKQNLRGRNAAPFDFEKAWVWWMGADALGRPLLARIIVATQNTVLVAAGAVLISAITGTVLGLIAGFIASKLVNRSGSGVLLDIVLGIVGAFVGGWLFNQFGNSGVSGLNLYSLLVATIGASPRLPLTTAGM